MKLKAVYSFYKFIFLLLPAYCLFPFCKDDQTIDDSIAILVAYHIHFNFLPEHFSMIEILFYFGKQTYIF